MNKIYLFSFLILFPSIIFSQTKKTITAFRTEIAPIIDGDLSDSVWQKAPSGAGFIQYVPNPGKEATQNSEFKILYDNTSIYVYAMNFDTSPDSISHQLTKRDDTGVADFFAFAIDPFNDAKINYTFVVTSAGVQSDYKYLDGNSTDWNWNAVWKSEVKIVKNGWAVEYKIPYSALRFPNIDTQNWGINVRRYINRTRESSSWSEIDPSASNSILKNGNLLGISKIKSPVRLSLSPFIATYIQKYDGEKASVFFKGGMDLKYGINESFTLDMMLIPDFGQVQSDDKRLNLSPFELYYEENRSFFTEGTELFNRADIFYSRRIGGMPEKYWDVESNISESEKLISNPSDLRMLNATKISGKTKGGLSLGFLNGMTSKSFAVIQDTITGIEREFVTQNFTNYNVLAIEQTLKNNSYLSFINTNYVISGGENVSNVTGTDFKIANKENKYSLTGIGVYSYKSDSINNSTSGYLYNLRMSKISGNFQFYLSHQISNDSYQNNDMGYFTRNNEMIESFWMAYRMNKPKGKFLNYSASTAYSRVYQFKPFHYARSEMNFSFNGTFLNHHSAGLSAGISPEENYDFYEPRVAGKFVITPPFFFTGAWISSNYNKKFALDANVGFWKASYYNQNGNWVNFSPRFRLSDRIMFIYSFSNENDNGGYGFTGIDDVTEIIYFGQRNINTVTNTLNIYYTHNNKISMNLRARYFRSTVDYNKFVTLRDDGRFDTAPADYSYSNVNFNAFNIDMSITGEFAPGSFITLVWKNEIFASDENSDLDYFSNFGNTWKEPQTNTISLKIIYYLDYLYLQRKK